MMIRRLWEVGFLVEFPQRLRALICPPPSISQGETLEYTKAFAEERSTQDLNSSVEYGKTLFQILIGTNGLAATALMTLAGGALRNTSFSSWMVLPLLMFLLGVFCGTKGAIALYQSKGRFSYRWQLIASDGSPDLIRRQADEANNFQTDAMCWINASALAFVGGGILSAIVLIFRH
jgi:hypothetical protein